METDSAVRTIVSVFSSSQYSVDSVQINNSVKLISLKLIKFSNFGIQARVSSMLILFSSTPVSISQEAIQL